MESSIISYLTARPSRDVVTSARQALTIEWWEDRRNQYEVYVSELVLDEIGSGDSEAAQRRLNVVKQIGNLEITEVAKELACLLIAQKGVPENSPEDALHIGIAASQSISYLLTWNFKHINNAATRSKIRSIIEDYGFVCPTLCSPEEL